MREWSGLGIALFAEVSFSRVTEGEDSPVRAGKRCVGTISSCISDVKECTSVKDYREASKGG